MLKSSFTILGFFVVGVIFAQTTVYNTPGNHTFNLVSADTMIIEVWGAGGGTNSGNNNARGGGGGGAYTRLKIANPTPGDYNIWVGFGGAPGELKGDSSVVEFNSAVLLNAEGGTRGGSNNQNAAGGIASGGDVNYTGGAGGLRSPMAGGGGGGSSAGPLGDGVTGGAAVGSVAGSGAVGADGAGSGAAGSDQGEILNGPSILNGSFPGGGAGGLGFQSITNEATSGAVAGTGGDGQVIITLLTALPVVFKKFTATNIGSGVQLNWTTTAEFGNDYFAIEKSLDARTFYEIGRVKGMGNSLAGNTYQFLEVKAEKGTAYYRIRQVDFDGSFALTDLVALHSKGATAEDAITVEQRNRILEIQGGSDAIQVQLYTSQGSFVRNYKLTNGSGKSTVDLSELPQGIFIANIQCGSTVKAYQLLLP